MSSAPRISLEQWRALQAVVDAGGYAVQAAAKLHKSQSAITYAVQKIEALLKLKIFELRGRKARLTGSGEVLDNTRQRPARGGRVARGRRPPAGARLGE